MDNKRNRMIVIVSVLCVLVGILFLVYQKHNKITLYYAAWNLGKEQDNGLERQMIASYMKEHKNVEIVILEPFTENYDQAMKQAVSENRIPDIFMYSGNALVEENDWCLDLKNLTKKDAEWTNIPYVLKDAASIKGKVIAIPSAIHFYGYFCNQEVLEKSGLEKIENDFTKQKFLEYVESATNLEEERLGLANASSICEWYPASLDHKYGWFTWDGGKLNLNSMEFKEAMSLEKYLNTNKFTFEMLDEVDKKKMQESEEWVAWTNGKIAFKFDGTWSSETYAKISDQMTFLGIPDGRTCIVPDFLFLSKNTKHPVEAYEFAKYMSAYSAEGLKKRIELAKVNHLEVATLPMVSDETIIADYFAQVHMKGIKEAYDLFREKPEEAYVEGTKVLPGYVNARWNYITTYENEQGNKMSLGEVLAACSYGKMDYMQLSDEINYMSNSSILVYPQQLNN